MLAIERSQITRSVEFPLVPDVILKDEGAALVADYSNGPRMHVKPSTGAANEIFAGVSLATTMSLDVLPYIEEVTVEVDDAGNAVVHKLHGEPLPGTSNVTLDGSPSENVALGATLVAGKYNITGNVASFHKDDAGKVFRFAYQFRPSVAEARNYQGDVNPGHAVSAELGATGTIQGGAVFTSKWDTSVSWLGESEVYLGSDGNFTTKTGGSKVPCLITELPSVDSPLLGISFNV